MKSDRTLLAMLLPALAARLLLAALASAETLSLTDGDLAFEIINRCFRKGLLFFSPVGFGGATVKIAPPLCIKKDAVEEGLEVLDEAMAESIAVEDEA